MSAPLHITPIPDGPFALSHAVSLRFGADTLPADETVYLCRCGESRQAPFCDGSHEAAGFRSAPTRPEAPAARIWEGQRIATRFDPGLCMHVFTCKPLKELRAQEVQSTDDAAAIAIRDVVRACPSGALTYTEKAPLPPVEAEEAQPAVTIIEGGELRLRGVVEGLALSPDQPADRLTLCRCGQSANKPFCDGRHKAKVGFR